jgi:Rps23 Pro-64 3,4-dihydroxylase Tpa1-like proline 4-hydroxylase
MEALLSTESEVLFSEEYARKLDILGKEKREAYQNAKPFPHVYFDDFLPVEAAEAALKDFPEPKLLPWTEFNQPTQRKLSFNFVEKLPLSIRNVLYFLNSRPMLKFLEALTGIEGIISDPYYAGGGLHQTKPGGSLEVHADFNYHPRLKLDRRINVLVYLNKNWEEEYGGHFEVWNKEMTAAEQKILPLFNRCIIFNTTSTSYHGHPIPLACPPNRTRKSMATFYYSIGRPEEEVSDMHSSVFQHRPGASHHISLKEIVIAVTPPIVVSAAKRLRGLATSRE